MNKCYGFYPTVTPNLTATGRTHGPEGGTMILVLAGLAVFALIMGALSLVTAPVALTLTALIGGWLLLFAARTALSNSNFFRKGARRG